MQEIITGWILYKIYWEIQGEKHTHITSDEKHMNVLIDKILDSTARVTSIELIYVREA